MIATKNTQGKLVRCSFDLAGRTRLATCRLLEFAKVKNFTRIARRNRSAVKSTSPADRVRAVWSTYGAVWNEMVSLHTPQQIGGKEHYRSGSHKGITYGYIYLNM